MNIYEKLFISKCPNNGEFITYSLRVETADMIQVEHINTACSLLKLAYHEVVADELFKRFGGLQTIKAHHHGVDITTIRGGA